MDRRGFSIVLCLMLVICSSASAVASDLYVPALQIVGDIDNPIDIRSLDGFDLHSITYKERTIQAISLPEVLKLGQPKTGSDIVYSAADLAARVDASLLSNSYLAFTAKNGWEVINLDHPVSSNIKRLEQIIVVARESSFKNSINIISPTKNISSFSVGQLHASTHGIHWDHAGSASLKPDTTEYTASVYTKHKAVWLTDLVADDLEGTTLIVGENGEMMPYSGGVFVLKPNRVGFVADGRRGTIRDVTGIILDAPVARNSDAFHDALHFLSVGESVLLVILDGFGYHQYVYARDNGYFPYMSSLAEAKLALSVYQPVTNAGLATILTGVGPEENGVHSRKQRSLTSPDIFEAAGVGTKSAYIVGDRQIISVSIDPVFNLDLNQSGSTDDEIVETTLQYIDKDLDLLAVHLKDIDRAGHNYGDLDYPTMETIAKTDQYLEQISTNWQGRVIVAVDHGMHTTTDGGSHGVIRYEDMFVPYIITEGGKR